MTLDYTKLAKDWLGKRHKGTKCGFTSECEYCKIQKAVMEFSTFLNERASREERAVNEDGCCDKCHNSPYGHHFHTKNRKPQEKPCCDVCKGYCKRGFCPCHRKEECGAKIAARPLMDCTHPKPCPTHPLPTPSKALEELDELETVRVWSLLGSYHVIREEGMRKILDKLNELVRYVKELERKINT